MILQVDRYAPYFVSPQAQSRAGGYHFLGNTAKTLARIIKNVIASAAEAEVAALYLNTQEALAN